MKGYIYKFTSPSNKSYIGLTRDVKRRIAEHKRASLTSQRKFYTAIRKYGFDSFDFVVLEEVESNSIEELHSLLCEKEKYYISLYDTFYNGYNLTEGGGGTAGLFAELNPFYKRKHTEETKKKISKAHKGKKLSQQHKEKIAKSTKEALKNLSEEKKIKIKTSYKHRKSVVCIETNKIYNSITECAEKLDISRSEIRLVCEGKRISAKNMTFRYVVNGVIQHIQVENKAKRKIMCVQTQKKYESITQASQELNLRHQHISAVLNGRQKTTKGLSFVYI